MTKNERIAELEREVAELRLELQRLKARSMPMPMMPHFSPSLGPLAYGGNSIQGLDLFRPLATAVLGGNDIAHFTYENGQTKFLAMERAS